MRKNGIPHIFMVLLSLLLTTSAKGQARYLSDFTAYVEGEQIFVSWTTQKGFTCENIEVQLGTDSNQLETIYTYLGVCGGELKEETYFYRIAEPSYNKDNYIRLNLGLYGFSRIVKLKPHKAESGSVLVFPSPATDDSRILFSNPHSESTDIFVYNQKGQLVSQLLGIRENQVKVEVFNLKAGMYYLHIIKEKTTERVKLLKSH